MPEIVETTLRARLIEAAIAALERGDGDLSLRGLARDVGVSAMAPYRHFADKAALMGAVAMQGFASLHRALAAADATMEGPEALVAQGLAYLRFADAHPALFRLMFSGACEMQPLPAGENAYDVLSARVATLTHDRDAPLACWALVHGLAVLSLDGQAPPTDRAGDPAGVLRLLAGSLAKR